MISEDAWLFIGTFWGFFAGTLEFYLLGNSGWLGVTSSLFGLFLFLRGGTFAFLFMFLAAYGLSTNLWKFLELGNGP